MNDYPKGKKIPNMPTHKDIGIGPYLLCPNPQSPSLSSMQNQLASPLTALQKLPVLQNSNPLLHHPLVYKSLTSLG